MTFGTAEARYSGSTALFSNPISGVTTLTQVGPGAFNLTSIDLAELNGNNVANVTFVGNYQAGGTTTQTFTLDGAAFAAQTFAFNSSWTGLSSVTWTQVDPYHQFDNIVVGSLPTANAGGPYTVAEGASLALSAAASTGDGLTYAWDVNGDGLFVDAGGATPTLNCKRSASATTARSATFASG